jgi:Fic family protein
MSRYIYQHEYWPDFFWDESAAYNKLLTEIHSIRGRLMGKMDILGFDLKSQASFETITLDILKSSDIEGEILNPLQVRSSVAVRLGIDIPGIVPSDRDVDGVVELMLDATQNFNIPLTDERLYGWHHSLFPTGRSGMHSITSGQWRNDSKGPMQVVSGGYGKRRVHYEAPDAETVNKEMDIFLTWFNTYTEINPIIKAAIAHLWFITIHPFDDGNGRIARAITDMQLARADGIPQRYYSMSAQIQKERKGYYDILEKTQKGTLEITSWIIWFLERLRDALFASAEITDAVLFKHNFWASAAGKIHNERQLFMLDKLLTNFEGNLTAVKWAKMCKCSADTALRDINNLIDENILKKSNAGGRSTSYELNR